MTEDRRRSTVASGPIIARLHPGRDDSIMQACRTCWFETYLMMCTLTYSGAPVLQVSPCSSTS